MTLGPEAIPFAQGADLRELKGRLSHCTVEIFPNGEGEDVRLAGYLHDPWANLQVDLPLP